MMEKKYMINFLKGKITELESLKKYIVDENSLTVINAKIDTLNEIMDHTVNAPVPFDLI